MSALKFKFKFNLNLNLSALNFECCYRLLVVFSPLLQNYHLICDTHFNTIVIDNNNL